MSAECRSGIPWSWPRWSRSRCALILFIVDTEIRISAVGERVTAGFAQIGRLAELSAMMERSSLGTALLADFLETAGQVDGRVNPLLQRLARREVERVTVVRAPAAGRQRDRL